MSLPLFQSLITDANFLAAWQRVRANLGAPGLDRVSIEDFEKNLHENLALLRTIVAEGNYQPLPYLTFTHKKESGKDRTLRIPTVRDRVVQQAILLVIQPLFEKMFLNCSYAYRPGKSSHQAIARVERNLQRGRVWIVDADIENFFDEIDRSLLMKFVAETIADAPLLKLIEQCVNFEVPVTSDQLSVTGNQLSVNSGSDPVAERSRGIAQGMGLAPLLSNIYLHKMDDRMFRATWNYMRYSDNVLVLCQSEEEAKAAMARAEECTRMLLLKFNAEKTSIRHLRDGFSFLGYYFDERGKRPDDPAVKRLGDRVGGVLQKAAEFTDAQLREKIDSIVRGWLNYFKMAETDRAKILTELEQKFSASVDSVPQRILQAAIAYQLGDRDRARQTLRGAPTAEVQDAQLNYQWGVLCEALELNNEALDSYLAAYRQNAEHPEAAYQLGLYYLHNRQPETALRYLQKAVQLNPNSAAVHLGLGTALQNTGLHGPARKSLQRATELDPKLNKLFPAAEPVEARPSPSALRPLPSATDSDLEAFLRLFSGREGVFSRQWTTGEGRMGYNTLYKPLTAEELRHHLSGQQTLGYYVVRSDNTVSQMVIDIDLTREVRVEIAKTSDALAEWKKLLWADAQRLLQALQDCGLKAYAEDSGYKGIHLWLFFGAPIPARDVLLFAKKILSLAGPSAPGLHREIFPKEERVAPQALGSMVKLPLGLHRLTNRRCWFLDNTGQPVADSFAWLRNLETISSNQFFAALEKAKASTTLSPLSGVERADRTEVDKIFAGCNVLRHFKEKSEKTKWLNHVERLTLASVLGHMGVAGHQTVHEIIRFTTNYDHRVTQKWLDRVKGYPISCPRIRERHSDITPVVGCCCQFPNSRNSYPSPVLHADPELVVKIKARVAGREGASDQLSVTSNQLSVSSQQSPVGVNKPAATSRTETEIPARQDNRHSPPRAGSDPASSGPPLSGKQVADLFQNYLALKKNQRESQQKVAALEQQLQALCEQQKAEQFVTEMGTFKRIKAGGEYRWVMEI